MYVLYSDGLVCVGACSYSQWMSPTLARTKKARAACIQTQRIHCDCRQSAWGVNHVPASMDRHQLSHLTLSWEYQRCLFKRFFKKKKKKKRDTCRVLPRKRERFLAFSPYSRMSSIETSSLKPSSNKEYDNIQYNGK